MEVVIVTKITTIRLDDATLEEIEYLHEALHLNTSGIIRLAISAMYSNQKRKDFFVEQIEKGKTEDFIKEV